MAGYCMKHGDLPVNTLALLDPQTGQALRAVNLHKLAQKGHWSSLVGRIMSMLVGQ